MSDHNDPHVVFEHSLRNAVRDAVALFDKATSENSALYNASVSITYDHDTKDGEWNLITYHRRLRCETRGPVLHTAMHRHIATLVSSVMDSTLPSLLPPPTTPSSPTDDAADPLLF